MVEPREHRREGVAGDAGVEDSHVVASRPQHAFELRRKGFVMGDAKPGSVAVTECNDAGLSGARPCQKNRTLCA